VPIRIGILTYMLMGLLSARLCVVQDLLLRRDLVDWNLLESGDHEHQLQP
jgi:hypothetical protein